MYNITKITHLKHIRGLQTAFINLDSRTVQAIQTEKKITDIFRSEPVASNINLNLLPPRTKIDENTIALLERLSLVDCANKEAIKTLEDAISFADQILQVNTKNIEPLVSVLEDWPLKIRDDKIKVENSREDILSNASITEEEYFVAPPGNIPLETRENLVHKDSIENKNEN